MKDLTFWDKALLPTGIKLSAALRVFSFPAGFVVSKRFADHEDGTMYGWYATMQLGQEQLEILFKRCVIHCFKEYIQT